MRWILFFLFVTISQLANAQSETKDKAIEYYKKYPLELRLTPMTYSKPLNQEFLSNVLPERFKPYDLDFIQHSKNTGRNLPAQDMHSWNQLSNSGQMGMGKIQQKSFMIGTQRAISKHMYDMNNVLRSTEFVIHIGKNN